MGTYDPKNITERKEFAKISKDYCKWGKFDRFKVDKSQADIGPGKYNADESRVSSRRATKSVYYQ